MEQRIKAHPEELKKAVEELRDRGCSTNSLCGILDTEVYNKLRGTISSPKEFFGLCVFYGEPIPHKIVNHIDGKGKAKQLNLEKKESVSELIGYILAGGHLNYDTSGEGIYAVTITLGEHESRIIQRANQLLSNLDKAPIKTDLKNSNAIQLRVIGKEEAEALIDMGIVPGNKVENNLGVPDWIFEDINYVKGCLRGLVDTDGSIYRRKDGYYVVQFKNYSNNLLNDFDKLCAAINVATSSAGQNNTQVASQQEVRKLISQIDPLKAVDISFETKVECSR